MNEVKNAADENQIKKDHSKEIKAINNDENDLKFLMSRPEFRRYSWRWMGKCKPFETIFNSHGQQMAYNSGRQDVGHEMMAEIMDTDPKGFVKMMEEGIK